MESDFVEQVFNNIFVVIILHSKHMDILKYSEKCKLLLLLFFLPGT